ncbi:MAG TPA: YceI family protein [Candidatus Binatia bacterium]|nr:YceI family protein [Candidatus Binatia bacterium]
MTDGRAPSTRPRARRPFAVAFVLILLGLAVAAGVGFWYLFGRSTPAPVALDPSAGPSPSAVATAAPTASPSSSGAAGSPSEAPSSSEPLDGTWSVDPSIGSFADFSGSFVGYRVQEVLVGVGAATAVGRTPDVGGSFVLDGTRVTEASFEADLRTLRSDSSMRDGQLRRQGLETDRFPTATFVLTDPIDLGRRPTVGEVLRVEATGDLTIHGVTRRIVFPLEARLNADGTITIAGSLEVEFADFGMAAPESFRVLSVDPRAVIELQLQLRRG